MATRRAHRVDLRKQGGAQKPWVEAWHLAQANPQRSRAEQLVEQAVQRLRAIPGQARTAYGWSGGKDSLALQVVVEASGQAIEPVQVLTPSLEWPVLRAWYDEYGPKGRHVELSGPGWDWLRNHPEMLFPSNKDAATWFKLVQHTGQRNYASRQKIDVLLLGRRTADRNYCGPVQSSGARAYRDSHGFVRLSPIADWSHDDVLQVLASFNVELPPSYFWPRGFEVGTGPWPARQGCSSRDHGWREILGIDPRVVEEAARQSLPGAAQTLRKKS